MVRRLTMLMAVAMATASAVMPDSTDGRLPVYAQVRGCPVPSTWDVEAVGLPMSTTRIDPCCRLLPSGPASPGYGDSTMAMVETVGAQPGENRARGTGSELPLSHDVPTASPGESPIGDPGLRTTADHHRMSLWLMAIGALFVVAGALIVLIGHDRDTDVTARRRSVGGNPWGVG